MPLAHAAALVPRLLAALILLLFARLALAQTVELSAEEKNYLARRGPVSIGIVVGNEPFALLRNGQAAGYSIDVLREIEARSGLRFELRLGNWNEVYNSFRAGRLDTIDAISHTAEREAFTRFTPPYHVRETALFENADRPLKNFRGIDSLPAGTRIGVVRDIYYLGALKANSRVELVEYPNYVDLVKSLAFGWLDGAVIARMTGDFLARENNLPNLRVAGPLGVAGLDTEDFRIGVRKTDPLLHDIVVKALASIPPETFSRIESRWVRYRGVTPGAPTALELNAEERAFVARQPVIRVGTTADYEPFSFVSRGEAKGFSVALIDRLAERIGVRVEPVVDTWGQLLERFRRGELDVIGDISWTEERAAYTLFSPAYYRIPNVVFVRSGFGAWAGIETLRGKRVGVTRDVFYRQRLTDVLGEKSLVEFEAQDDMMRALSFGRIDAVATALNTGNNHIRKLGLTNIEIAGELRLAGVDQEDLRFGVAPRLPILHGLIGKALASMPAETLAEIENRWLSARPLSAGKPLVRLNEMERAFLERKGALRLCIAPDWMPYAALDGEGRQIGMIADLLEAAASRGGLALKVVPARSWAESLARARARECDVLAPTMASLAEQPDFRFAAPLVKVPGVIATRVQAPFIDRIHEVLHEPLGIVRGHPAAEYLRDRYPAIRLVEVDSDTDGLARTQRGEIFGYIGSMAGVAYQLLKTRSTDLKIGGRLPEDWRYGIATRSDEPELHAIFQRLFDAIDPDEQQQIVDRWLAVRHEPGFDTRILWQGLAATLALLAGFFYWNTRLKRLNQQLAAANVRLHEMTLRDPLTGLYNRKYLRERVGEVFGICQRRAISFAVVMIDLDHFKAVNDRHGHPFGDACLRQVAAILGEFFQRQSDTAIRYGGEEFAAILSGDDEEPLALHLERLRQKVEGTTIEADDFSGQRARITISVGCCCLVPQPGDTPEAVIAAADAALYRAKHAGRNRVVMAERP